MKKRWKESEVDRDAGGRFTRQSRASATVRGIRATAAERNDLEDRRDDRLRWGPKAVANVWFMPKGPSYWIPRSRTPETIRGNYYVPSSPWPVVPPRGTWATHRSYDGIPGVTVLSRLVPSDIMAAAAGTRTEAGASPRKDVNTARRRAATGALDEQPAKRGVTRVTKSGR